MLLFNNVLYVINLLLIEFIKRSHTGAISSFESKSH